jgi:hypothetical protein
LIAAVLSSLRGEKFIHEYEVLKPDNGSNTKQQETEAKIKSKQKKMDLLLLKSKKNIL